MYPPSTLHLLAHLQTLNVGLLCKNPVRMTLPLAGPIWKMEMLCAIPKILLMKAATVKKNNPSQAAYQKSSGLFSKKQQNQRYSTSGYHVFKNKSEHTRLG
mmetsp:Transcript_3454/g.5980  ORF Transcript_3454/g.5980 Transcript_3454/m.5980 type:complete len:101 (+) Transcript_3454:59-361(+)